MDITDKKIAFITGVFPAISETWLINQIADLRDKQVKLQVFSFEKGRAKEVSDVFHRYKMPAFTCYLDMPSNIFLRIAKAIPKIIIFAVKDFSGLVRSLNFFKYGRQALSLQLLYWCEPLAGQKFDLYHCHYGTIASRFLKVKEILKIESKMITSFYGQDVSRIFKERGDSYYDGLKKECDLFIVMSEIMKDRIISKGFDPKKIRVLPIFGINVSEYQFKERSIKENETMQLVSVGRFVEKKGFDDLIRAMAILKHKTSQKFMCNVIGGGELEASLKKLTQELGAEDVVSFRGYMKLEEIIKFFMNMHLYLQPSKTASNGDME